MIEIIDFSGRVKYRRYADAEDFASIVLEALQTTGYAVRGYSGDWNAVYDKVIRAYKCRFDFPFRHGPEPQFIAGPVGLSKEQEGVFWDNLARANAEREAQSHTTEAEGQ